MTDKAERGNLRCFMVLLLPLCVHSWVYFLLGQTQCAQTILSKVLQHMHTSNVFSTDLKQHVFFWFIPERSRPAPDEEDKATPF